jgi:hypothetical protein
VELVLFFMESIGLVFFHSLRKILGKIELTPWNRVLCEKLITGLRAKGFHTFLLFNPKVHCHIQKSSTLEPVLSQLHLLHNFTLFFNFHFHILLLGLQISVLPQIALCITRPVHPNLFHYITLIIFVEEHQL